MSTQPCPIVVGAQRRNATKATVTPTQPGTAETRRTLKNPIVDLSPKTLQSLLDWLRYRQVGVARAISTGRLRASLPGALVSEESQLRYWESARSTIDWLATAVEARIAALQRASADS